MKCSISACFVICWPVSEMFEQVPFREVLPCFPIFQHVLFSHILQYFTRFLHILIWPFKHALTYLACCFYIFLHVTFCNYSVISWYNTRWHVLSYFSQDVPFGHVKSYLSTSDFNIFSNIQPVYDMIWNVLFYFVTFWRNVTYLTFSVLFWHFHMFYFISTNSVIIWDIWNFLFYFDIFWRNVTYLTFSVLFWHILTGFEIIYFDVSISFFDTFRRWTGIIRKIILSLN